MSIQKLTKSYTKQMITTCDICPAFFRVYIEERDLYLCLECDSKLFPQ